MRAIAQTNAGRQPIGQDKRSQQTMRTVRIGAIVYSPFGDIARYWADMTPQGQIKTLHWFEQQHFPVMRIARAMALVDALMVIRKGGPQELTIVTDCPVIINAFHNSTASLATLSTLQIDIQKILRSYPKPKPIIMFSAYSADFKNEICRRINGGE